MSETWVINETPTISSTPGIIGTITFTSNGNTYGYFGLYELPASKYIGYDGDTAYDTLSGWSNTAYRTVTFETSPTGDLLTWLEANAVKQSSQLSIDLSTLSGWADLSSGTHTITLKAKADGYRDSPFSEGVSVTKASPYIPPEQEGSNLTITQVESIEQDGSTLILG